MPDPKFEAHTAGGLIGRIAGRTKAAVGSWLGREDLKREGDLQHAQSEAAARAEREARAADLRRREVALEEQHAGAVAERNRLRAEVDAEVRERRIEAQASMREREIEADAERKRAAIRAAHELDQRTVDIAEGAVLRRGALEAAEAARLEHEADVADAVADVVDPEAK